MPQSTPYQLKIWQFCYHELLTVVAKKITVFNYFCNNFWQFFLRHTITTAVQLCWSVENFGILNHNSTRCTCKVFLFWGRVHISRPYCSRILNFSRIYFLEQKMKQNSAKVMKQNFWIVLFSRILNFGRKSNGFVFCWKIKFCKSCGM